MWEGTSSRVRKNDYVPLGTYQNINLENFGGGPVQYVKKVPYSNFLERTSKKNTLYILPFYYLCHAISKTVSFLSSPFTSGVGKILTPLNQKGPPLGWKIWKIVGLLILIAQMKGFDALNAAQKTSALCKVPFLKKQEKEAKMVIFDHFDHFWPF